MNSKYLVFGRFLSNVSVLVAVGVNDEGYREILGIAEGSRENKESWTNFLRYLKDRGLFGVKLIEAEETCKKYCRNAEGDSCAQDWEMGFPYEHWTRLRTNNALERIMKEICRRTRVIGVFPDGYSAMMLVGKLTEKQ